VSGGGDVGAVLARSSLFAELGPDALASLASGCRTRLLRKGQTLFFEGDPSEAAFVIVEGRLKATVASKHGEERLVAVASAGVTIGELGCLDGSPRSASVAALSDVVVVVVPAEAVWRAIDSDPGVRRTVLGALATAVRRVNGEASDLVFLDLPRRLAKLLVAEVESAGSERLRLGLSQTDLGQRLGATRQSVNTALRAFVRRGWISLDAAELVVVDPDALRRFLGT
jgi:CRP/FNR family cyclic AMP-dependent transcriptional regulator